MSGCDASKNGKFGGWICPLWRVTRLGVMIIAIAAAIFLRPDAAAGGRFDMPAKTIEQVSKGVGDLIQIKLVDGRLVLDRDHWVEADKTIDKKALEKQYRKDHIDPYKDDEDTRKAMEQELKDILDGPPQKRLFFQLQGADDFYDRKWRDNDYDIAMSFSNYEGLEGALCEWGKTFELVLSEKMGRNRRLAIRNSSPQAMCLMFTDMSNGSLSAIIQRPDGKVLLGRFHQGRMIAASGTDFASAYRRRPQQVQAVLDTFKRLGVRFSGLGVAPPVKTPAGEDKAALPLPPSLPKKPGWKRDIYQGLGDAVGKLVALRLSPKGLRFDVGHWKRWQLDGEAAATASSAQDRVSLARTAMSFIEHAAEEKSEEYGGSSSSTSEGSNSFSMTFSLGGEFSAALDLTSRALDIEIVGDPPARRRLAVVSRTDGSIRVQVDGADGRLLLVQQDAKGQFVVIESAVDGIYMLSAPSFGAFARKYHAYTRDRLFGYLKFLGVTVPLDHEGDRVKDALLLGLAGPSADDAHEARKLIAQLESPHSLDRDKAAAKLTVGFRRYRKQIDKARAASYLSADVRDKLEEIGEGAPSERPAKAVIDAMGLLDDVDYLTRLLAETTDDHSRKALAERIRQARQGGATSKPMTVGGSKDDKKR